MSHGRTAPAGAGVLLVTGGSRGIGAAVARQAAARGWDVAINYARDAGAAEEVAQAVRALGRRALTVRADVSHEPSVVSMFVQVDDALGPVTGLANNAGVVDVAARVDAMSVERLHRMVGINLIGSMLCAREAVRRMSNAAGGPFDERFRPLGGRRGGAIVNLSSAASRLGSPGQYVDYAAVKGAIDTFTLGLAREVAAEGVRVNAVRPGIIDTDIHASGGQPERARLAAPLLPILRAGTADEVAAAVLWLLSPEASYTTGAIVDVSGGR